MNSSNIFLLLFYENNDYDRLSRGLAVTYKLEAEVFTGSKLSRVFFKGAAAARGHEVEKNVTINTPNTSPMCQNHVVYVIVRNTFNILCKQFYFYILMFWKH